MKIKVTFQQFAGPRNDDLIDLTTHELDLTPLVAEMGEHDRENMLDALKYIDSDFEDNLIERAMALALLPHHEGPFHAGLWFINEDDLKELFTNTPHVRRRVLTPGAPLARPVSMEDVVLESDEEGWHEVMVRVTLNELLDARQHGVTENDLFASKVSHFPAHKDSTWTAKGLIEDTQELLVLFVNRIES